ncbi:hypothetical protein NP493_492g01000 [Ridgeia piscesae]|uniref:Uncharacterized protein n=1 Tax=Ridgeia piscesae TaxID=27915 RepID=A0AAD9KXZ6_RIDPI|nr:hypothetical protein NP493_492g01000 [Ridgeia piscesae]
MAPNMAVLTTALIGLVICDVTSGSRILMLPSVHRGTVMYFMEGGEVLKKAGHEVYLLVRKQ